MIKRALSLLPVLLAFLLATGCVSLRRPYPEKKEYLLTATHPGATAGPRGDLTVALMPLRISPAFEKRNFLLRIDENEYEPDRYSIFLIPPARNITEAADAWLRGTSLFSQVVSPNSAVLPTHLVEGNVVRLYGDYRDDPAAVLEVQFALIDLTGSDPRVVFQKSYLHEEKMQNRGPDALVEGWNGALAGILAEFEADVAAVLPAAP